MYRKHLIALLSALCLLAALAAAGAQDQTRVKDVVYAHKGGVALTMDVFKPPKPNGIGLLWMVSGGWVSSHEGINPALAEVFTKRGMTVFQVVHGAQPRYIVPEIVQDIHRAVRFVRTHAADYGVDPNRLGISGGSAGGHLSLMMGAYGGPGKPDARDQVDRASSAVQAIACFFPPTDFLNYGKEGQIALDFPLIAPFLPAFGVTEKTTAEEKLKMGRELSPIYGALEKMPPTLIVHGDADLLVPIQQSERLLSRLKQHGVPQKLVTVKGQGHGWTGIERDLEQFADWFAQHLAAPPK